MIDRIPISIKPIDLLQDNTEEFCSYYVGYQWVTISLENEGFGRWCLVVIERDSSGRRVIVDVIVPIWSKNDDDDTDMKNIRYVDAASDAYSIYLKLNDKSFDTWNEFHDLNDSAFIIPKSSLKKSVECTLYRYILHYCSAKDTEFYSVKGGFFEANIK